MLDRLSAPEQPQHPAICFTYWLQWHLSKQLKSASEFARQHQIALKGDLPIGDLAATCLPALQVTAQVHRFGSGPNSEPCSRACQERWMELTEYCRVAQ